MIRTGYGVTYNATPWARAVRGDNDYPITMAISYPERRSVRLLRHAGAGHPDGSCRPNQSSGRVPLDRAAAEYTPEVTNIDRGYVQTWNVAFERRVWFDTSVDVAYVGAKGTDGYAALDINAPTVLGTGNQGRPYFNLGRIIAVNSWGDRLKTDYQSLQVSLNKPFTHGLLFKGAYTFSKSMNESDNDGRSTLNWNTPSELWRQLGAGGLRSPAQLPDRIRLCAAVAERRKLRQRPERRSSTTGRLTASVAAFSGHAVHGDCERHGGEYAE